MIKKSWKEVTVKEFFLLAEIEKSKTLSVVEKKINILSVLSDKPTSEWKKEKYDDIQKIFETDLSFIKTQIGAELQDYYFVNGKKYKLIRQISDLQADQFIDLLGYTEGKDNVLDSLHLILTVFLMPIKELTPKQRIYNNLYSRITRFKIGKKLADTFNWKYNEGIPETYKETDVNITSEEIYNYMPIEQARSITVFFCVLKSAFWIYMVLFLEEKKMKTLQSALKNLKQEKADPKMILEMEEAINTLKNGHG